jgi:hypothetical protein
VVGPDHKVDARLDRRETETGGDPGEGQRDHRPPQARRRAAPAKGGRQVRGGPWDRQEALRRGARADQGRTPRRARGRQVAKDRRGSGPWWRSRRRRAPEEALRGG